MLHRLIPNKKQFAILFLFWLCLLPLFYSWLSLDRVTPAWDLSGHAKTSFRAAHSLAAFKFKDVLHLSNYYPPLFYVAAAPLTAISSHPHVYCAANWFFLLALMWATWLLALRFSPDWIALATAALIPAYVYISWMCRMPMMDLALAFFVTTTLCLLCGPQPLRRHPHALGICIALGMLTKWPYAFFTAAPLAYAAIQLLRDQSAARAIKMKALASIAAWPLALAGPWYYYAIPNLLKKMPAQLDGEVARQEGDPSLLSFQAFTVYGKQFYESYARAPLTILAIIGICVLAITWISQKSNEHNAQKPNSAAWFPLFLSLCYGYAIVSLIANKDPRYIMPLVPLVAVLSTHWLGRCKLQLRIALALIAFAGSYAMVYWNFHTLAPPHRADVELESTAQWIATQQSADPKTRKKNCRVLVIPNDWYANATGLDYALYRRNQKCSAQRAGTALTKEALKNCDYALIIAPPNKNTGVAPFVEPNTRLLTDLEASGQWQACYQTVRPDGKTIKVLRPTPSAR